jgi:hypothetical protein
VIILLCLVVLGVFALAAWGIRYQRVVTNSYINFKDCSKLSEEEIIEERDKDRPKCYCFKNNYFRDEIDDEYYDKC